MIGVFLSQFWVQRLGWTLLHFLWQGTAIVGVYAMLRRMLGRLLDAQGRYALACLALAAMTVAPPLTFVVIPDARGSAGWTLSAAESQRLLPVVVAVWLLGVLAFSICLFGGWRFAARLRSTAHPAPAEWRPTLERIAAQVDVPLSRARLLVSSLVSVPTVIGWLRPAILVPFESLTGLSFGVHHGFAGARDGAHPPARLPCERTAKHCRGGAVLPSGCLVDFRADSRRA